MTIQPPISCEAVIEQLFDYLDKELVADTNAVIDRHLQHCHDCFSRAEFEKELRARIAEVGRAKASDLLRQRIQGLIDRPVTVEHADRSDHKRKSTSPGANRLFKS